MIEGNFCIDGITCSGNIAIPKGVTHIGDSAFAQCSQLDSIMISASVTGIGREAFSGTSWLARKQEENTLVICNALLWMEKTVVEM